MACDWQQKHTMATVDVDLKDAYENYLGTTKPAQSHLQESANPFQG